MSQTTIRTKVQYAGQTSNLSTEGGTYTELSRCQSCTIEANNNIVYDRGLGEGFNVVDATLGPYDVKGSLSFHVVDFDMLKHWVGPKSGAGASGDHYKLTEATAVDFNTSSLQPFSLERLNDTEATDSVDVAIGCTGTDFELSGEMGGKLVCDANWIGRHDIQRTTHEVYTPVTTSAFIMINGTWKWGATPTALAGVRSFKLAYSNGLVTDTRSIEGRFINTPKMGARTYNFEITIIMAQALQATLYTDFYGGALTPEDGSTTINPTPNLEFKVEFINGSRYATLWLDHCSLDTDPKATALGDGLVLVTFTGTAKEGKGNVPIEWWTV